MTDQSTIIETAFKETFGDRAIPHSEWAAWSQARLDALKEPEDTDKPEVPPVDYLIAQHIITTPPMCRLRHSRPIAKPHRAMPDRVMMMRPKMHAPNMRRRVRPKPAIRIINHEDVPLPTYIKLLHRTITSEFGIRFGVAHGYAVKEKAIAA